MKTHIEKYDTMVGRDTHHRFIWERRYRLCLEFESPEDADKWRAMILANREMLHAMATKCDS